MFWIELPAGFCLCFLTILLVIGFFQWQQRRWNKQMADRTSDAYRLYEAMARYTPEQQATILKSRGACTRRLYYYACRRWDETGNVYDDMEEALQNGRKVRKLRRIIYIREFWQMLISSSSLT